MNVLRFLLFSVHLKTFQSYKTQTSLSLWVEIGLSRPQGYCILIPQNNWVVQHKHMRNVMCGWITHKFLDMLIPLISSIHCPWKKREHWAVTLGLTQSCTSNYKCCESAHIFVKIVFGERMLPNMLNRSYKSTIN